MNEWSQDFQSFRILARSPRSMKTQFVAYNTAHQAAQAGYASSRRLGAYSVGFEEIEDLAQAGNISFITDFDDAKVEMRRLEEERRLTSDWNQLKKSLN